MLADALSRPRFSGSRFKVRLFGLWWLTSFPERGRWQQRGVSISASASSIGNRVGA
jgi:hypothetical protein